MRIEANEIQIIKNTVRDHFGLESSVLLFGSRTDDDKRGGDIDLLIESELSEVDAFRARIEVMTDIQLGIGDQKIDIVVAKRGERDDRAVVRNARNEGIAL